MSKPILLSGIKPTGRPHIGNFFGALRQFVELQDSHQAFVMIADYHALTSVQNKEELSASIIDLALDYLGAGLDPQKAVLFKQSDVPEHTELAWIFNTITTMPYLMRAHAFKDAEAKNKEINVGVFDYPLLMAADILLYTPEVVPVGQDQKQHVEIARDTAEKFNHTWKTDVFNMPKPLIVDDVKIVPGTDGRKMSKSYKNTIALFATDEEIHKAVMGIVTDSSAGIPQNVYELHKLFRTETELAKLYAEKAGKYKDLKEALANDIKAFVAPFRARRAAFEANPDEVRRILQRGAEEARKRASQKMQMVRKAIGVGI